MRLSRLCMSILLWVLVLGSVTPAIAKALLPAGTLTTSTTSVAVSIGVNWGTGILITQGHPQRLAVVSTSDVFFRGAMLGIDTLLQAEERQQLFWTVLNYATHKSTKEPLY